MPCFLANIQVNSFLNPFSPTYIFANIADPDEMARNSQDLNILPFRFFNLDCNSYSGDTSKFQDGLESPLMRLEDERLVSSKFSDDFFLKDEPKVELWCKTHFALRFCHSVYRFGCNNPNRG